MALILFGRGDCSLCRQAEEALRHADIDAELVDIDDDVLLEARYGLRIPVLRDDVSNTELDWPFDAYAIRKFCAVV